MNKEIIIEKEKSTADVSKWGQEMEFGSRSLSGFTRYLIPFVAGMWSIFQLSLPKFLLINSEIVRCIHLAFAIVLVYLSFPTLKTTGIISIFLKKKCIPLYKILSATKNIPLLDYLLMFLGLCSSLYLAIDYQGIAERQGMPSSLDLIMGTLLIILLLEASRRSIGPALSLIAGIFIFYSFFSESMPDIISFKNASLSKIIGKLTMGTEGIYGVPLDVSANTVFLFVLFGSLLNRAGGGQYFIQLAFALLGRFKGGPAKAAVLASGLTGMVSGSSIANTVTTGTFTIPLMKKAGYPGIKAGAIEVAASTNGQLMPPIMGAAAFIIAEYCHLTYFQVVKAAFIPAMVSYLALIFITHLEASKLNLKGLSKNELPQFWKVFRQGIYFLIPLAFLFYSLIIKRYSAQLSAFWAIVALIILIFIKGLIQDQQIIKSSKDIWEGIVDGGRNMMTIGVAVGAAGIIVGIVTLGLGNVITEVIDLISMDNIILLLIITAITSLILGMGLPTTANYIVMATLTAPVIVALSGDSGYQIPLLAAHLFCFYFGILADDTPPVGLAAYAAAAISKENPIKTGIQGFFYDMRTAILPFMFVFNTDLLLINIDNWWHIILIFSTALLAMFAFASLTQNYFITKNKPFDSILLLSIVLILLCPQFFTKHVGGEKIHCYIVGIALSFIVYLLQSTRHRSSKALRQ